MPTETKNNLIKSDVENSSMKVNDDGSVTIIELVKNEYKLSARDFITFFREMEQTKIKFKESLTDERKKLCEENLKKVEEEIDKHRPILEEAEAKAKEHYEKQKLEGMFKKISEELDKPMGEINLAYMSAVWENIKINETKLMEMLTSEQKHKFLKLKRRRMTAERGSGKK